METRLQGFRSGQIDPYKCTLESWELTTLSLLIQISRCSGLPTPIQVSFDVVFGAAVNILKYSS